MQKSNNANKHLTLEERKIILYGIEAGSKKSSISVKALFYFILCILLMDLRVQAKS